MSSSKRFDTLKQRKTSPSPELADGHAADELAGRAVLATVGEEEVLQRQRPDAVAPAQLELAPERDEGRREVADRRAVGDVAADGARGPDLPAAEPAQELAEVGVDPGERRAGIGVGRRRADAQGVRPVLQPVEPGDAAEGDHLVDGRPSPW